jgi:PAS domain S-box-containing protein
MADKAANGETGQQNHPLNKVVGLLPGFVYQLQFKPPDDWQYLFVGPRVQDMFGYSVAEVLADADTLLGRIHWNDVDRVIDESLACGRSLTPWHSEFRMLHRDGHQLWVEAMDQPQRRDDGTIIWTGWANDITDRKRNERRLHVQSMALEAAANAIVITDPEGYIEWANKAFTELSGYTLDEARGRRPGELTSSGQQDETFYEALWETILSGEVWQGRVVNRRKDGQLRSEEMTITPVRNQAGSIIHFIAVKQDITERLELEDQLRRTQRLESIGQLTGGIAHDFNNLLTVIMGNAELLADALIDQPRLKLLAEMVVQGAQRGSDLTGRLLAFARKQPLEPKSVDINALIARLDQMLARVMGEDIEIRSVPGQTLWLARIDAGQLEDALLNLAINARDAMPDGGRLTIETGNIELDQDYADSHSEVTPGDYVLVAVSDTGCGIARELFDRVFEPFFSTKEKGRGTGLGLAMVYGFIKQSGGHVSLYSEVGEGTTVKLYLPRMTDPDAVTAEPPEEHPVGPVDATILLVEDDAMVRAYVQAQLENLGYRVLAAADGQRALAILRQREDIDLLFTDIVMPGGMNGRELADAAKALKPDLKVLFTSGYTENAIVHHGRLDDGALLLGKPYRRAELDVRVREALTRGT